MNKYSQTLYLKENFPISVLKVSIVILMIGIISFQISPALGTGSLERVDLDNPMLVNAFGSTIGSKININQQVQITSDMRNNQSILIDEFVFIVQVKDSDGRILSLSWASVSSNANWKPNQVLSPAVSWTPELGGEYTAEIFVWDSFKNQSPLADKEIISITVS